LLLLALVLLGLMTLSSSVALAVARAPSSSHHHLRTAAAAAAAQVVPNSLQALRDVYCRGPLLHDVQVNHVFADSKHFVDMPLKASSSAAAIPHAYSSFLAQIGPKWMLMDQSERVLLLKVFLDQHFDAPGTDMAAVVPLDYQESTVPAAIDAITSPAFREWGFQLHKLWKVLGRVPQEHVVSSFLHAPRVPSLPRTQNVLVVPGGRFRESYYWDSFWIVEGLLVSGMRLTARGVVNNLLEYVAEYGFVPNGGRIYYLSRSQPPLLSDMVKAVAEAGHPDDDDTSGSAGTTVDIEYLRATVPILEKEYAFWMQLGPSTHAVEVETTAHSLGTEPKRFVLNRYVANADEPRPESYREDFHDATLAFKDDANHSSESVDALKAHLYNDIIAAAESGWDFSSRWLKDGKSMATSDTSNVVPVDLNVMMHRFERNLAHFHALLGNADAAALFTSAAATRAEAIQAVFWSPKAQSWRDYLLDSQSHSPVVAVSNYAPLWSSELIKDAETAENVIESLRSSGLVQVGGIQTTTEVTGQQWDGPNAWPPMQDMVIEGLLGLSHSRQAQALARDLMRTWVRSGYVAWQKTGLMFEKYNATVVGGIGLGGEYIPQFGFGWTNGVILKYLAKYGNLLEGIDRDA
jgi:alpha,alpha-trehalase